MSGSVTGLTRGRPRRAASDREFREGLRLYVPAVDALGDGLSLRESSDGGPVMHGHFAVFNRWTEIDSFFEGNFMESISPGAFRKTFKEQRSAIKVLFQHGRDPQMGSKPLGPIETLEEDKEGARYEVPLVEAWDVREILLPRLRAGLLGASFRFRVLRELIVEKPEPSEHNPRGLPERTIKEAHVSEFGPVTFPAYQEATAGVRSVTDDYFYEALASGDPEVLRFAASWLGVDLPVRDSDPAAEAEKLRQERADLDARILENQEKILALSKPGPAGEDEVVRAGETDGSEGKSGEENDEQRKAAPGRGPTPLLGVRKEPWRL